MLEVETAQEMAQAVERFEQAMAELQPFFEALREALIKCWEIMWKVLRPILVFLRRCWLYVRLVEKWCFPSRLARWVAWHWPERWLPAWAGT